MNDSSNNHALRKQVVYTAQGMNASGINQGTSGNISVRIKGGMLITPSSIPYERMQPKDLVAIDLFGNPIKDKSQNKIQSKDKKPSSEWRLHSEILRHRPEINAVVHCHSIHATALACHGKSIPSFHYMTAIAGGTEIRCADYATFGSEELSMNALNALKDHLACLLTQHGQVAIASCLEQALRIATEVETLAHMYLAACQLGEPKHINEKEMKRVLEKFNDLQY